MSNPTRTARLRHTRGNGSDSYSIGVPADIGRIIADRDISTFDVTLTNEGLLYVPNTGVEQEADDNLPDWLRPAEAS